MGKVEIASSYAKASEDKSAPSVPRNDEITKLKWKDNASVLKLLDVIASIIADEYIEIAKKNPNVFSKGGNK